MTTDQIETLVADAVCINSCIPQGMQLAVLIYLASQIVASGGTGGGGGNPPVVYTNDPNTEGLTPANTTLPAVAYSSNGQGSIFGWSVALQQWV